MSSENVKLWRQRTKDRLVEAFGSRCGICGYNKSSAAFDFHHLDPSEKDFSFGRVRANPSAWPKLVAEARKCVMLCSNCHREVHAGVVDIPEDIRRFDESFAAYKALPRGKALEPRPLNKCSACFSPTYNKNYCSLECSRKASRKVDWDSIDLKFMYGIMPVVAIAKKLGVSDVAVHKRLKKLGLK